ncbi:MAG: DNA primase [Chloroflexi bacterium]|nr:DNA primase [Chloroflexota bacterium]MCY3937662.1 DNA primase [Chloroflexota bacterium]
MTAVDSIKERITAAEVIGRRVTLAKSGRYLKGLCPFHSEKTPSFFVFPDTNTFKCFGCGEGGDVFTFVMKTEGMEFPEALRQLADEAGVELPARRESGASEIKEIVQANVAATSYFREVLLDQPVGNKARDYVERRGLSDTVMEKFQVGYAPAGWDNCTAHLLQVGISPDTLLKAGLSKQGDYALYDSFRDRLIFPIWNGRGDIVGFGGRTLGDDPAKYLNTARTAAFDKSAVLYGLNHARAAIRSRKTAVVVEGYMDAVTAHQFGFNNVVAAMGTSVTPAQLGLLRSSAERLIMCLDADAAGAAATRRGLEMMSAEDANEQTMAIEGLVQHQSRFQTDVLVATLPAGTDPDDIIRRDRSDWKRALSQAAPLAEHLFRSATDELDLSTLKGRSQALETLAPIIRRIDDPAVQSLYVNRLSRLLRIPEEDIRSRLRRRTRRSARRQPSPTQPTAPELDEYLLARGLSNPRYLGQILTELHDEDFRNSENRLLAQFLSKLESAAPAVGVDDEREVLEPALLERLESAEKLCHRLPPLDGEALYSEMRSVALRLRRDRLRAENKRIQVLLSEEGVGAAVGVLLRRQSTIFRHMNEIEIDLRQLSAGRWAN